MARSEAMAAVCRVVVFDSRLECESSVQSVEKVLGDMARRSDEFD